MEKPITVMITEDKTGWRQMLVTELAAHNIRTIGEAGNGFELQALFKTQTPDIVLLDLKMPEMDGSATMSWLNQQHPAQKVIIMSFYDDNLLMQDYFTRGAKGFVPKDAGIVALVTTIKKVYRGGHSISYNPGPRGPEFSHRQKEIISLAAEFKSNTDIARDLGLTPSGVDKQRKKIMGLMGIKTLEEFYQFISRAGLYFFERPVRNAKKNDHKS